MVGMNVGARQFARARRVALTGACLAAAATEAVGLTAAIFPRAWLHLFTGNEAALDIGTRYLHVVAPAYGLFGFGLALYFASQGAKRMGWSVGAGFVRVALVAVLGAAAIRWSGAYTDPGNPNLTPFLLALVAALVAFAAINLVPWLARVEDRSAL